MRRGLQYQLGQALRRTRFHDPLPWRAVPALRTIRHAGAVVQDTPPGGRWELPLGASRGDGTGQPDTPMVGRCVRERFDLFAGCVAGGVGRRVYAIKTPWRGGGDCDAL